MYTTNIHTEHSRISTQAIYVTGRCLLRDDHIIIVFSCENFVLIIRLLIQSMPKLVFKSIYARCVICGIIVSILYLILWQHFGINDIYPEQHTAEHAPTVHAPLVITAAKNEVLLRTNEEMPINVKISAPEQALKTPSRGKHHPHVGNTIPRFRPWGRSFNQMKHLSHQRASSAYQLPKLNLRVNWSDLNEACSPNILETYHLDIPESFGMDDKGYNHYKYDEVPKRTLTYWLSHIENKQRLRDKAYFADKYSVKQYIQKTFVYMNYARALVDTVDYINKRPSFEEFVALKTKYGAFLIKPNHYCSEQIIIKKNDDFTMQDYTKIMQFAETLSNKYYTASPLEKHYLLIKPQVFVEEHLNVNRSDTQNDYQRHGVAMDDMVEYKFAVINYKCVFLYVIKKPFTNLYSADNFTLLAVRWGLPNDLSLKLKPPSPGNFEKMKQFSEDFARREQFKFVRVDLYEIRNKIYFSEFTFTPQMTTGKILPVSFDYALFDILCNASRDNIDNIYKFVP
eukprot:111325_1